jgi:PTH1 family peptidyl-tRNA hydrolase
MFLLVGLGNFGLQYENTRHNYGFLLIDKIISRYNLTYHGKKFSSDFYQGEINGNKIFAIKPQTYMNLSGIAVLEVMSFFKIDINKIIICHDDLDIAIGKIKCKIGGGSGGHNGIKSIDKNIGSNYLRLRLGIQKPIDNQFEVADFVLSKFSSEEIKLINDLNDIIASNIDYLLARDIPNFLNKVAIAKNKK